MLCLDPGSFHHLLLYISPTLWLSSSLLQEGREGGVGWGKNSPSRE